jgi:PAS domain S-box-containing protein
MLVGVLAIQALLTPLLFYGILFFVESTFQSQFVDQVRNATYLRAALLKAAVIANNVDMQKTLLSDAYLNEDLVLAEFVSDTGDVIRPDEVGVASPAVFREDFQYGQHGDKHYYIAIPIFDDNNGDLLGSLRVGYDERPTEERIGVAYRFGVFLATGYALLSFLLVIFFASRLFRPISGIQKMARSIATGDHDAELKTQTNIREIQHLTDDLESMRQTLVSQNKEMKERERRLQAILDHAGDGIISIDPRGLVASFNLRAESIFGYTADEVLGQNVSVLMPPSMAQKHDGFIGNYLSTGHAKIIGYGRQLNAKHKDSHIFPIHLTVTEIRHEQEHIFIGIIRDLTREVEKENQLRQFWSAVEQSPISIMITNTMGEIEYVNPYFCEVSGYAADEVYGSNASILKSGNTDVGYYQDLWRTISEGAIWRGELQNRKKNGEVFWEAATICPVHDDQDEITHYIALKEDITERREKDRMLTQAMKMEVVGRMTDVIAHDFNNLLTIIRGNLQYLESSLDEDDDSDTAELIADAVSAANDGANLIEQLLVFSRRGDPDSKPMDVTTVANGLKRLASRAIPKNIKMKLEVSDDAGSALIGSNRLESAVLNLVINARDAMPNGGELSIYFRKVLLKSTEKVAGGQIPAGKYIMISVSDTGCGMSEEIRQQALEPFFTTKSGTSGTGLGLSMVNDLVTQYGGGVRIESEPGNGTSIYIILPHFEQDFLVSDEDDERMEQLPTGSETILVVEDQEKVRRFACRVLKGLGYQLIEAENAIQALRVLRSPAVIDLLFSDIMMPGEMDGIGLAEYASTGRLVTKILLTTGMKTDGEDKSSSITKYQLLRKPYSMEQLAHNIRRILDDA